MSRPRKKRSLVYIVSIGAHLVVGAALALIPQEKLREVVAIAFAEAPKPKPAPPRTEAPQRSNPPPRAARSFAPARSAPAAPAAADAASGASPGGFTNLGLSLDSSSLDGLAVPVAAAIAPPSQQLPTVASARPRVLLTKKQECEEPLVKARPDRLARPSYTADAREAQIEGRVRLELQVDETGAVSEVRVLSGLGHGLDEQAMDAARRMTFKPATRCGKRIAAPFVLSMRFQLGS